MPFDLVTPRCNWAKNSKNPCLFLTLARTIMWLKKNTRQLTCAIALNCSWYDKRWCTWKLELYLGLWKNPPFLLYSTNQVNTLVVVRSRCGTTFVLYLKASGFQSCWWRLMSLFTTTQLLDGLSITSSTHSVGSFLGLPAATLGIRVIIAEW